jgi:hypothetical protein
MCYSRCPYESYWGACANTTKQGAPDSHCADGEKENNEEEETET